MQQILRFNIELPLYKKIRHNKEKSYYNHNYYLLEPYGDWVDFGEENNNILYVVYDEYSHCYSYYFGYFNQEGKFISVFGYTTNENVLDGMEIE